MLIFFSVVIVQHEMNITDGERRRIEYQRNHKDIILKVLIAHLSIMSSILLLKREHYDEYQ